jgi:hypothetical protein
LIKKVSSLIKEITADIITESSSRDIPLEQIIEIFIGLTVKTTTKRSHVSDTQLCKHKTTYKKPNGLLFNYKHRSGNNTSK